ncbi:MAG: ABC transporter permease [Candidatus Aminicenantes bacterium]|nr:ABC transporter permease [Candidatus Aminicenantes bacterium]
MQRLKAVIIKEFFHILRDPASLTIVFLMPVLMVSIYGYSISFDLKSIDAGIIDLSGGNLAGQLIKKFANNQYFRIRSLGLSQSNPIETAERLLKSGELKEVIIIPPDFSRKILHHPPAEIGIVIDGSDSNVANLIHQYNEMVIMNFVSEFQNLKDILTINTSILFNPEVKSTFFFIPGIIAIILLMISALLTSLSISRERESGSIDLIFISPLKSHEIIIGKTIPYIFVALLDGILIFLFARFWFHIPFKGNLLVLLIFSLLYILSGLSLGILISSIAPSQKTAMLATLLITLLPSILLSGFIFSLDSMAPVLRSISYLIPATYFLKIIRGVAVKGAELKYFLVDGLIMIVFSALLITLSSIRFSHSREKSK